MATRLALRAAARSLSTVAVAGSLATLAATVAGPAVGAYRIETVLSGSMRPAFAPGDVLVVTPEPTARVRVGQVISYAIPIGDHHVESHRVVRILRGGAHPVILTKGDANGTPDPWRARLTGGTAWRVRAVVPGVGRVLVWLRQPPVRDALVLGLPTLLATLWLIQIWRPRRPEVSEPA